LGNIESSSLKYLESTSNIKLLIQETIGKEPSTRLASEISVCLQQGRMFFDAATESPIEIKPLQIFYGMIGFAKAITLARSLRGLETFRHSHGLIDITPTNSKLESMELKILSKGTFQDFNNVVCNLERIHYLDKDNMPSWHFIATSNSDRLKDKKINIKDILARIPGLGDLYQDTFHEHPKAWPIDISYWEEKNGFTELRIDDPEIYNDRASLETIVKRWKEKFPFLNNWCLCQVAKAWGYSIIIFCNVEKDDINEFANDFLVEKDGQFREQRDFRRDTSFRRIDFRTILPPLFGGIRGGRQSMVEPY
jgi:hypothetical protein